MPYADKVVHVTLSGQMMGGAEEWQTGFYLGFTQGAAGEPTQALVDGVRNAWSTFWTTSANGISSNYTFTQVKAARLGTDGKYDGSAVVTSFPATAQAGGSAGNPMPPQLALVATLVAGSGKGLAGKGRMYLPGVREVIDGGGKLNSTYCQNVANNLAAFFNAVNLVAPGVGEVINASKGQAKFAGLGARNVAVNGVRVGNVYDTQRRRREALAETYSTAVVAD